MVDDEEFKQIAGPDPKLNQEVIDGIIKDAGARLVPVDDVWGPKVIGVDLAKPGSDKTVEFTIRNGVINVTHEDPPTYNSLMRLWGDGVLSLAQSDQLIQLLLERGCTLPSMPDDDVPAKTWGDEDMDTLINEWENDKITLHEYERLIQIFVDRHRKDRLQIKELKEIDK